MAGESIEADVLNLWDQATVAERRAVSGETAENQRRANETRILNGEIDARIPFIAARAGRDALTLFDAIADEPEAAA